MQEKWTRWEPINGLANKYDINCILTGKEGLIVRLYEGKNIHKKVDVVFKHYADSYRETNESFRIKVINTLTENYGKEFYTKWTFFKITNSEYLKWLSVESCGYSQEFPFIHFCIVGTDSIIDIIARYEPMVTIVKEK